MTNKQIIEDIKKEIKEIKKDYDITEWDSINVDKMESGDAYNRGYYRALASTLKILTTKENKSFFQKLQDFMEKENFKLTKQTNDGKDIFTRKEDKIITEIFIED